MDKVQFADSLPSLIDITTSLTLDSIQGFENDYAVWVQGVARWNDKPYTLVYLKDGYQEQGKKPEPDYVTLCKACLHLETSYIIVPDLKCCERRDPTGWYVRDFKALLKAANIPGVEVSE